MKTYAADNLMFLREQYPAIYKVVRNRSMNTAKFHKETSRNGESNLSIQGGDSTPQYIYSKYNPSLECERWAMTQPESIRSASDVVMIGLGLGYHACALISVYPEKKIYLIEPDLEMLIAAVESVDLRPLLKSKQIVLFAVGDEESVKMQFLVSIFKAMTSNLGVTVTPVLRKLYPGLEAEWESLVFKVAHGYSTDVNTIAHHAEEWIENVFVNLKRNFHTPNFYPLKGGGQGIHAIIVGSGPSLEIEAERLLKLQDKTFIIAAGTATAALLHHGIRPHLIISMDPGEPNRLAFMNLDVSDIPFLYVATMKHSVIQDEFSPYLMHGYLTIDRLSHRLMDLGPEDGLLSSTSSVTGTAIQFAVFFGCKEITFIGQDFSYPNDQIYAQGVQHLSTYVTNRRINESQLMVPNIQGGNNRTNESMNNLRQDVEFIIQVFPDIKFYNASPVGAVIKNTGIRSLKNLQAELEEIVLPYEWFKTCMKERLSLYPEKRRIEFIRRAREMNQGLSDLEDQLKELESLVTNDKIELKKWLSLFEAHWKKIVESSMFQEVLAFYLTKEKDHAERYWREMYQETDNLKKQELLKFCAGPILQGLRKLIPKISLGLERLLTDEIDV